MIWYFFPLLFRWLNTLGMLANQGIDVVIRHSFFDHGYNHLVDQNFNPLPVSVRQRFPTPFPCLSVLLIVLWSPLGEFFSFCYSLVSQIGQKYFWPILQTFSFTSQTYPNIYTHVCTYGFMHIHIYVFIYIYIFTNIILTNLVQLRFQIYLWPVWTLLESEFFQIVFF